MAYGAILGQGIEGKTINASQINGALTNATIDGGNITGNIAGSLISGNIANATIPANNVTGLSSGWEFIQNWTAQNQYWSINLSSDYREYMIIFTNNNSSFSCPCVRNENNNNNGAIYTKWVTAIPSTLSQLFGSQTNTSAIYAGDPNGSYVGGFIKFTLSGINSQKIVMNSTMFPSVSAYSAILPIISCGYLTGNTFLMATAVSGSSISYPQYNASLYGLK